MRIKSDVTEILEDTMGRDTREEKINIMMAAMEELNMYASEEGVGQFSDLCDHELAHQQQGWRGQNQTGFNRLAKTG